MKRLILWLTAMIGNKRAIQIRTCKLVKMCFDDVDWAKQSFIVGGAKCETDKGDKVFYSSREIDKAIEKLNRVLTQLG